MAEKISLFYFSSFFAEFLNHTFFVKFIFSTFFAEFIFVVFFAEFQNPNFLNKKIMTRLSTSANPLIDSSGISF